MMEEIISYYFLSCLSSFTKGIKESGEQGWEKLIQVMSHQQSQQLKLIIMSNLQLLAILEEASQEGQDHK